MEEDKYDVLFYYFEDGEMRTKMRLIVTIIVHIAKQDSSFDKLSMGRPVFLINF